MTKLSWIQIGSIALGILLMVGGDRLGVSALLYVDLALIGLGLIVGGGEAIVTRRYVLRRREFSNATYYWGWPCWGWACSRLCPRRPLTNWEEASCKPCFRKPPEIQT